MRVLSRRATCDAGILPPLLRVRLRCGRAQRLRNYRPQGVACRILYPSKRCPYKKVDATSGDRVRRVASASKKPREDEMRLRALRLDRIGAFRAHLVAPRLSLGPCVLP